VSNSVAEQWRDIPGWEGFYQASSLGRVRSRDRVIECSDGRTFQVPGIVMSQRINVWTGYYLVGLRKPGEMVTKNVHSLIARAFLGERPPGLVVCHDNGKRTDNRVANLRYDSYSANELDKVRHATHHNASKTHCPRGHELAAWNIPRDKRGWRKCLACTRARSWIRYHGLPSERMQEVSDRYYHANAAVAVDA